MMRTLSRHRRFTLRAIGPGVLLVVTACLPNAAFAAEEADASQRVCDIPYICDRDTNRGGSQTATGTHDSGGSPSSPTSDPEPSSPTSDPATSSPTGD